MALLFTYPHSSPLFSTNPSNPFPLRSFLSPTLSSSLSFPKPRTPTPGLRSLRLRSSLSDENSDPVPGSGDELAGPPPKVTDEWGEEAEPEPEPSSSTKLADSDPPKDEDEWGGDGFVGIDNGGVAKLAEEEEVAAVDDKLAELKRCLVDTVYGTELGFRASLEERAEILELVNQLEAANPTPAPTSAPELLDGNWVLLYTGFSELLPLLAAGSTPLLKVDKITQSIDTSSLTIVNSTTLSSPFSIFSFSASATFEVRSPSRIQVQFKEGTFQPPEIKSAVDLPGEVDVFGQKINLSPLQQTLNPIQEAVANISRAISGQPPLKLPIPGERNRSWLLITYLDADFRISRGDGGLFVLAKEGSTLLDQ
ncbi:Plastid lipid-associated protein/fibrillin conserved domain containing protein [Trema orientale]|uniref:Plastid lipid-associated protein/fibrillin conserved domain containing protein n=1 Tax=Trema orientale TaxID=63057 RepID=A0A2P5EIM1_TREOI|nr:Plastid lipid-associated protein/fibrillin conserved domain containing protein [Trema orientale]